MALTSDKSIAVETSSPFSDDANSSGFQFPENLSEGNGGGGGNGGGAAKPDEGSALASSKLRVVMSVTLVIVVMTFGALVGAFIVLSANRPLEWRPFELPEPLWLSTLLLIASSVSLHFGQARLSANNQVGAHKWFRVTAILGALFLASQIWSWIVLSQRGVYLASNPYAGFFYVFTAVHAFHVIGGICGLLYLLHKTKAIATNDADLRFRKNTAVVTGWYWHLMDFLWIALFLLLGFWR